MSMSLKFASVSPCATVPYDDLLSHRFASATTHPHLLDWMNEAALTLDTSAHGIAFKIGQLRLGRDESRRVALWIAEELCTALKRRGAPAHMHVEVDRVRPIKVWGHQTRTLLPHTDGAHCSYLTPSLQDNPTWVPTLRTFSSAGFSTTTTHKLYQGILVLDPGEALSLTTYYDWLAIIRHAYLCQIASIGDLATLAKWLGANIRAAVENQTRHGNRYLSIGAALGLRDIASQGVVLHAAEEEISDEETVRFPQLKLYSTNATDRSETKQLPRVRFLNSILQATMGLTWEQFRQIYEVCVPSERFDFVIAHNLSLVHGGLMGGPSRALEPVCLVMKAPEGIDYERWLAQSWRRASLTLAPQL